MTRRLRAGRGPGDKGVDMQLTAQNFCGLLVRSRLFPAADAKALLQRWLGEGGARAERGDKFAQYRDEPPGGPAVAIDVARWSTWDPADPSMR